MVNAEQLIFLTVLNDIKGFSRLSCLSSSLSSLWPAEPSSSSFPFNRVVEPAHKTRW